MPRGKTISFTVSAVKDLEAIHTWYVDQQVPAVSEKLLRELISQVERLADFPENGRVVPELGLVNLREVIYSPFRIVYRVDANRVRIVRVWRSERLLKMP